MPFGADLRRHTAKYNDRLDRIVSGTVEAAGDRAIILSPVGDPPTWKNAPPAGYEPGNFRGNWFYSANAPIDVVHHGVGITDVNDLAEMPALAAGLKHYVSNNLPYAQALEYGHSGQAPNGVLGVLAAEMTTIAETVARKVAG